MKIFARAFRCCLHNRESTHDTRSHSLYCVVYCRLADKRKDARFFLENIWSKCDFRLIVLRASSIWPKSDPFQDALGHSLTIWEELLTRKNSGLWWTKYHIDSIECVVQTLQLFQLFINYHKFYRKQYPLPAVSRLASRGEQWLHVCNTYTDRSQERLEKKSS